MKIIKLISAFLCLSVFLLANEATVEEVKISKRNGTYSFAVRILHEDSGWEHYVDRFEILDMDGNILATRTLWHPHANEQPFTRSLANIKIDSKIQKVYIRAHDSVDEYSALYETLLP
ncbi:MAG: hypothetical protein COA44_05650 [Arcobacter sp.]|nr:MAG: hypothetical protein COA44_05650 [Arcobacter sp.]